MLTTPPSPDWAIQRMKRVTKLNDQELLNAVLELLASASGLTDSDRYKPEHISLREDAVQAALEYGYRHTTDCEQHCSDFLGIAV